MSAKFERFISTRVKKDVEEEEKPRIAIYWCASCGGCEIAFLEIAERILDLAEKIEIVFCPCIMDIKYHDVWDMPDDYIDITLFNGAIRNDEHLEMAYLLRDKSKILVAYGSCAAKGCIPALANFNSKKEIFDYVYKESPSTVNPEGITPQPIVEVPEGELELPAFWDCVKTLDQIVQVDYYVPGCPPAQKTTNELVDVILSGKLPKHGSYIGSATKSVCDDCPRERKEKKIKKIKRPHLSEIDPEVCLLDQGFLCCGPATRGGCGAQCPSVNMPCIGCYGPLDGIEDQGAKMLGVIASVLDYEDEEDIKKAMEDIVDPAGYLYKFSMSKSLLFKNRHEKFKADKERLRV
ncbi:MAG: oxidoreductase [Candidatus Eremiobacteraeota bacterium]|nr:oxidoreductase [Candidatus Eremiobacteraeota bacterium]